MHSDLPTAARTAWRGWITTFSAVLVGGLACLYVFVLVADPFSTGRFSLFDGIDIAISSRAWSNAGRLRDREFDAAIIGNSRGARFAPAQLDALTAHRFVQLSVAGTGPNEQMAIARAFVRAHAGAQILLLFALDDTWCRNVDTMFYPQFRFWLYESSNAEYFLKIFSPDAVQAAFHRLAIRAFGASQAGPRDGYEPHEPWYPPEAFGRDKARARPTAAAPPHFPFADRMAQFVGSLPDQTGVVLVFMPYYVSFLPMPDTPAAAAFETCKSRYSALAQRRSSVAFFDFMRDDEAASDPANFAEITHVTGRFVQRLTETISPALRAWPTEGPRPE